ncbi:MAG: DUF1778 domain-containing protein [Parachlamydia sp.]|nr:DUF1778 domain-containing protein [Parachlamydia sp.]
MHFLISSHDKHLIEKAARLKGLKSTTYARQCLLAAAERDLPEFGKQKLVLNEQDWTLFMSILSAPIKPNKNLKKAFDSYHFLVEVQSP